MKKTLSIIGAIVLVAAIAAGSFWGGMTYQEQQANQVRANFMNERGIIEGQMPGGMPPDGAQFSGRGEGIFIGSGTIGVVKAIDGDVLTISTAQDVATINLTADTQVNKTVDGSLAELTAGMRVSVSGPTDTNGNITAVQISILDDSFTPPGAGSPAGTEP